jgi:hypothetical protein
MQVRIGLVVFRINYHHTLFVYRLGQRVFSPLRGVRFPYRVPYESTIQVGLDSWSNYLGRKTVEISTEHF